MRALRSSRARWIVDSLDAQTAAMHARRGSIACCTVVHELEAQPNFVRMHRGSNARCTLVGVLDTEAR